MPAPATAEDFLTLVRQSGLVEQEALQAFLQQGLPVPTPRHLAGLLVSGGLLTRFQAEQLLRGKWRGFMIGKYRVLERLGSGGHSNVYLCEHRVVRRKVAIKVLPTSRASNPSILARFYREARAAGALDHPNLVKAHDVGQDGDLHIIVMDYVDGTSLQEIVTRFGPLSIPRAIDAIYQAARGLHRLHEAGLAHRDIKPGNILLGRNGVIRLLDLGLARFFCEEAEPLTLQLDGKNILGTADYLSPEQALNSHDVDIRTDIYSLGATFYFLLSGQPLFPGGTIAQKLMWHQVRQPRPIGQVRADVPPELAALVMRMVAKRPGQRYQTMPEVMQALLPWLQEVELPPQAEMPCLSLASRPATVENEAITGCFSRPAALPAPAMVQTSACILVEHGSMQPRTPTRPVSLGDVSTPPGGTAPTVTAPQRRPTTLHHLAAEPAQTASAVPAAAPPIAPSARAGSASWTNRRRRKQATRLAFILTLGIAVGSSLRCLVRPHAYLTLLSDPSRPPAQLVVAASGQPDTFATLREALQRARPGDHILVRADTWEEALTLDGNGSLPPGVCIIGQAPDGGPVVWRAPPDLPVDQPLVQLQGCEDLTLAGFLLDGQGRTREGVVVRGACAGLRLEDLHLSGFRRHGVVLRQCQGGAEEPVCLRRLRFTTEQDTRAALVLDAPAGHPSRQVVVQDCRIEGPYQAAIEVRGPCEEVHFQHNRIYRAGAGLRSSPAGQRAHLVLAGNTFCSLDGPALHLASLPDLEHSHLQLMRNLFVHTHSLAQLDGLGPGEGRQTAEHLAAGAFGNVCDRLDQKGVPPFHSATHSVTVGTDAGDDAHFLRYPATTFVGADEAPGVPPVDAGNR